MPETSKVVALVQRPTEADRPNTVAGLVAKQKELRRLRHRLEEELHKVVCDLDHLDAAIRLFDPAATPEAVERYTTQHRAKKGHMQRFVLAFLRNAGERGGTSREIAEEWIAARGLHADEATYVILRKRVGACLIGLRAAGLVRNGEARAKHVIYVLIQGGLDAR